MSSSDDDWITAWLGRQLKQTTEYAVMLMDLDGRLIAWLPGAEHLFGYAPQEVLGKPLDFLFVDEDRRAGIPAHEINTARRVGKGLDDRWHLRKDGSRLWASGMVAAVRSDAGDPQGFVKIVRDRTDVRMQIEGLKHRVRADAGALQRQETFIALLAHELRNPLSSIGNALAVMERMGTRAELLDAPFAVMRRQLATLQRLVDDLMDMTRMATGKLRLDVQPRFLQGEIEDAVASSAGAASAKGIEMELVLPEVPITVEVDSDRFQQILTNLLGNAIRYTDAGGHVWVKANVDSGHAVVRVEDTGRGIAPELQPAIFDLFTQGPRAGERRSGGLGLGLALVKELVTAHGGSVTVRSEGDGKGSEFMVRLPLTHTYPTAGGASEEGA